jgi:pimeloyl-ACP methyl ester carboxylesterase
MEPITTVRKLVTVAPGVEIYTERRTLPTTTNPTETILFVHGLGCSINSFYPVFSPILSARPKSTLLAYDWSGCGLSPFPGASRPTLTARNLVDDLDKLVELEASEGPLIVISHSAGVILTIRWLTSPAIGSLHIARIKSAIFIGGPVAVPVPPMIAQAQYHLADVVLEGRSYELEEHLMPKLLGPSTRESNPLAVALMRCILVGHNRKGLAEAMIALTNVGSEGPLLWERFPEALSVLFIGGKEDLFVRPDALEEMARGVKGSQIVIFDLGQ